jgi:hypothetical protein
MSSWLHCEVDAVFLRFLFFLEFPLVLLLAPLLLASSLATLEVEDFAELVVDSGLSLSFCTSSAGAAGAFSTVLLF